MILKSITAEGLASQQHVMLVSGSGIFRVSGPIDGPQMPVNFTEEQLQDTAPYCEAFHPLRQVFQGQESYFFQRKASIVHLIKAIFLDKPIMDYIRHVKPACKNMHTPGSNYYRPTIVLLTTTVWYSTYIMCFTHTF